MRQQQSKKSVRNSPGKQGFGLTGHGNEAKCKSRKSAPDRQDARTQLGFSWAEGWGSSRAKNLREIRLGSTLWGGGASVGKGFARWGSHKY
eukprot:857325-Rhodomonas_salina.1